MIRFMVLAFLAIQMEITIKVNFRMEKHMEMAAANMEELAAQGDSGAMQLLATKEMQEMNQSFNLQYLELQQNMQQENRKFSTLSNIMKTKHDTAKATINNVR